MPETPIPITEATKDVAEVLSKITPALKLIGSILDKTSKFFKLIPELFSSDESDEPLFLTSAVSQIQALYQMCVGEDLPWMLEFDREHSCSTFTSIYWERLISPSLLSLSVTNRIRSLCRYQQPMGPGGLYTGQIDHIFFNHLKSVLVSFTRKKISNSLVDEIDKNINFMHLIILEPSVINPNAKASDVKKLHKELVSFIKFLENLREKTQQEVTRLGSASLTKAACAHMRSLGENLVYLWCFAFDASPIRYNALSFQSVLASIPQDVFLFSRESVSKVSSLIKSLTLTSEEYAAIDATKKLDAFVTATLKEKSEIFFGKVYEKQLIAGLSSQFKLLHLLYQLDIFHSLFLLISKYAEAYGDFGIMVTMKRPLQKLSRKVNAILMHIACEVRTINSLSEFFSDKYIVNQHDRNYRGLRHWPGNARLIDSKAKAALASLMKLEREVAGIEKLVCRIESQQDVQIATHELEQLYHLTANLEFHNDAKLTLPIQKKRTNRAKGPKACKAVITREVYEQHKQKAQSVQQSLGSVRVQASCSTISHTAPAETVSTLFASSKPARLSRADLRKLRANLTTTDGRLSGYQQRNIDTPDNQHARL